MTTFLAQDLGGFPAVVALFLIVGVVLAVIGTAMLHVLVYLAYTLPLARPRQLSWRAIRSLLAAAVLTCVAGLILAGLLLAVDQPRSAVMAALAVSSLGLGAHLLSSPLWHRGLAVAPATALVCALVVAVVGTPILAIAVWHAGALVATLAWRWVTKPAAP